MKAETPDINKLNQEARKVRNGIRLYATIDGSGIMYNVVKVIDNGHAVAQIAQSRDFDKASQIAQANR